MGTETQIDTEKININSFAIDRMSTLEMVELINSEDAKVAEAVKTELPQIAVAIDIIARQIKAGGRLIYVGAGTSGRLGILDASECPPTFNTPPEMVVCLIAGGRIAVTQSVEEVEDDFAQGRQDVINAELSPQDVLVGITASGRTPYVLGAVEYARSIGTFTMGLACNADTELSRKVDLMIAPVVGPEIINGSTRMKSGTAQKMVLNMLSTGAMIKLGRTFGNLMVDVRPLNVKLRLRAVRIIQAATDLDEKTAEELLHQCYDDTKVTIVAALAHLEPEAAKERLDKAGGVVRKALEGLV